MGLKSSKFPPKSFWVPLLQRASLSSSLTAGMTQQDPSKRPKISQIHFYFWVIMSAPGLEVTGKS